MELFTEIDPKIQQDKRNEKLRQTDPQFTGLTKQPSVSWTDRLNDRQGR